MKEARLCQVCGENRAVFAFEEAGVPTRHVCTSCHQESLPEPARSLMKAMKTGPCRYCGKAGQAVVASQGTMFRFPFEKDFLCGACQMDFVRAVTERSVQGSAAKTGSGGQELLKGFEKIAREVDGEMRRSP